MISSSLGVFTCTYLGAQIRVELSRLRKTPSYLEIKAHYQVKTAIKRWICVDCTTKKPTGTSRKSGEKAIRVNISWHKTSGNLGHPPLPAADSRPTYIGLANTIPGVTGAVAPLLGGLLVGAISYQAMFSLAAVIGAISWALLRFAVREPRKIKPSPSPGGPLSEPPISETAPLS